MWTLILHHAIPLCILLTLSQITGIYSAPVAVTTVDDCDLTPTSASSDPAETVLEASDGQVYVPANPTGSISSTGNNPTEYSTTAFTSYYTVYHTTIVMPSPETILSILSTVASLASSTVQTASLTGLAPQTSGVRIQTFRDPPGTILQIALALLTLQSSWNQSFIDRESVSSS